jgi:hypothetical protein
LMTVNAPFAPSARFSFLSVTRLRRRCTFIILNPFGPCSQLFVALSHSARQLIPTRLSSKCLASHALRRSNCFRKKRQSCSRF